TENGQVSKLILPTVRFSETRRDQCDNSVSGYFDVFYFNSEIPIGSRVFLQIGYEMGKYSSIQREFQPWYNWHEVSFMEMLQWEDFGWYLRLPKSLIQRNRWHRLIGIDLKIEIKPRFSESGTEVDAENTDISGHSTSTNYLKGLLPDMKQCASQSLINGQSIRSCPVDLMIVPQDQD
ncbi:MAG: hypothetical protein NT027_17585, partial [Proteobacteria bacterium]|nr:hypothetical protein [Pseudomonadota bacterium]